MTKVMSKLTYYVGAGSRDIPRAVGIRMQALAKRLAEQGVILRTGGAPGANAAFLSGVVSAGLREMYLPWPNFNRQFSQFSDPSEAALDMAERYHPAWHRLNLSSRKLMACNTAQVLGPDLHTPARFVVVWTPDGTEDHNTTPETGEAAQIIRVAADRKIPIFNLQRGPQRLAELGEFLLSAGIVKQLKTEVVDKLKNTSDFEDLDDSDDSDESDDESDDEWEDCPDDEFDPDDPEWEYEEVEDDAPAARRA
jgi:hypothetical protein